MTSCTLTDEIVLAGDLTIIGQTEDMDNLKTITATADKRHFKLDGAAHKLNLWYVKLTGADVSGNGGSIFIDDDGGELKLYYSEISGNKATSGSGVYGKGDSDTNRNAIVNIYNSVSGVKDNEAVTSGGGMFLKNTVTKIENTVIENNEVKYGGGVYVNNGDVTITNSKISSNDASIDGGGLYIYGGTVTLRQSTFDSNTATGDGDEIWTYGSPTITLVNTVGLDTGIHDSTATWKTCFNSPCTVGTTAYWCL